MRARSLLIRTLSLFFDLAGVVLVILMLATVVDIVARHLGLFSVRGIVELSIMAVMSIGFLALSYSFIVGGHIVVDLATQWLPRRITQTIDAIWLAVAACCLGYLAWHMWQTTIYVYSRNDLSLDLQMPTVVFWLPATAGVSIAPIACVVAMWQKLRKRDGDTQEQ